MKNKKSFALIIILIILFLTGCEKNKILLYETNDPSRNTDCIGFSVYGKDGEEIIGEIFAYSDYKKNITVADLSRDICRELNIPIVFAGVNNLTYYVKGINGLFEFEHGAESGWLYSVNGEFQGTGCGTYILKYGDFVEWHYTLDLGKDLGAFELDE